MTEQTDAAEVEALARETFDLSGTPENWWVDHRKGYEQHAREIIRSDWLAAREARAAERALREAADDWHRTWPMRPLKPSDAEWVEDWLRDRAAARGAEGGAGA